MRISYWSSDVCSSDLPPGRFSKRISATSDASNPASWASEKPPSSSTLFSRSLILSFLYQTSYELFGLHERSEEHTSELQSLMRISYAVFCLKKKNINKNTTYIAHKYKTTSYYIIP